MKKNHGSELDLLIDCGTKLQVKSTKISHSRPSNLVFLLMVFIIVVKIGFITSSMCRMTAMVKPTTLVVYWLSEEVDKCCGGDICQRFCLLYVKIRGSISVKR
ncbi:hypothetical protein E3N88_12938 [Mikania micrantha]|uniref:Transmembrane protein n=1 Tax=Mikania micrantha TaxID=192012 RepID=A0A5N6P884_9ASTR|nr:hypothetical protein E3N88_12938 [Mikania micrantha]